MRHGLADVLRKGLLRRLLFDQLLLDDVLLDVVTSVRLLHDGLLDLLPTDGQRLLDVLPLDWMLDGSVLDQTLLRMMMSDGLMDGSVYAGGRPQRRRQVALVMV